MAGTKPAPGEVEGMTDKTELGPLPERTLAEVLNLHTNESRVSDTGAAYYGSHWVEVRKLYTAADMREYAIQERAAERERWSALLTDLRVLAKCCMWPDGDGAPVTAQMWAEEWVRKIDAGNARANLTDTAR